MLDAAARRYAQALFDIACDTDKVDEWQAELQTVAETVAQVRDLERALYHPRVTAAQKRAVLAGVFGTGVSKTVLDFLFLLVDRRREVSLPAIVARFVSLADERRGLVEAEVESAVELSVVERERLDGVMEKITARKVRARYRVEPALLGGVVVRIGDRVLDGSLHTRLTQISDRLRATS